MISRIPLSCLRQSLFKQSVRSINATVAASARGRFETKHLSKEWLNKNISLKKSFEISFEFRSNCGETGNPSPRLRFKI